MQELAGYCLLGLLVISPLLFLAVDLLRSDAGHHGNSGAKSG
ncbi:MAG: hypothetical protein R3E86_18350 [Pseudomonadales bacterium]